MLVAEELLAHVGETTSPEQYEQVQKGLLFYWQELKQRVDPLHLRFPGGHRCLDDAYLHYAMLLRARAVLQKPLPSPAPPAPPPQPRTDAELMERLKEYVTERTKETFFGQEQVEEEEEESA
jgi:hypothetical protein